MPEKHMDRCTIILVVYDRNDSYSQEHALPAAVDSLLAIAVNQEVILVNNQDLASCPRTSAYLRHLAAVHPEIRLVETDRNTGCAGGFNAGYRVARKDSDFYVYMSGDALVVQPDMLQRIVIGFERYPKAGLLHPLSIYEDIDLFNVDEGFSANAFFAKASYEEETATRDAPLVSGEIAGLCDRVSGRPASLRWPAMQVPLTFLAIRRAVFEKVGLFDDGFLAGGENIDFTLRALQAGFRAGCLENSFVFHRRLLFRQLGSAGKNREVETAGQTTFNDHWKQKWGALRPIDVYRQARYGKVVFFCVIRPAVWLMQYIRTGLFKVRG